MFVSYNFQSLMDSYTVLSVYPVYVHVQRRASIQYALHYVHNCSMHADNFPHCGNSNIICMIFETVHFILYA